MKTQIRIIAIFSILILASLVADQFHSFLGDTYCQGRHYNALLGPYGSYTGCDYVGYEHSATWHYGYKHWVLIFMSLTLFVYNVVSMVNSKEKS